VEDWVWTRFRITAYLVKIFLRAVGLKPTAIIGHSFGGKGCHILNPGYIGSPLIGWDKGRKASSL